jgi:hypothetical protein
VGTRGFLDLNLLQRPPAPVGGWRGVTAVLEVR